MHLKGITQVIAGYTFRGAIKPDIHGNALVFQAKDLIQGETVRDTSSLAKVSHDPRGNTGYLKKGDVLLVARGMKSGAFRSTVYAASDDNVIASSSIHIIRVIDRKILPEFLSLYLNSKEGQDTLSSIVTGSYIGALPRKELEKIEIPMPSFEKQQTLIQLYQNIRAQQKITSRQNEIRQNIISATFKSLVTA